MGVLIFGKVDAGADFYSIILNGVFKNMIKELRESVDEPIGKEYETRMPEEETTQPKQAGDFKDGKNRDDAQGLIENRNMYNLPGFPAVTERDVEIYAESRGRIYSSLPDMIRKGLKKGQEISETYENAMPHIPEEERVKLILEGLGGGFLEARVAVAKMIKYIEEPNREMFCGKVDELIEEVIAEDHARRGLWVEDEIMEIVQYGSEDKRGKFIQRGFENKNLIFGAVKAIQYAPERIRKVLNEKLLESVTRLLEDENSGVREMAIDIAYWAPEEIRAIIIQKGLKDDDLDIVLKNAGMIDLVVPQQDWQLLEEDILEVILKYFEYIPAFNQYTRQILTKIIRFAPKDKRMPFVIEALKDDDSAVQEIAAETIKYIPESEERRFAEKKLADVIRKRLEEGDLSAARMLDNFPVEDQLSLREKVRDIIKVNLEFKHYNSYGEFALSMIRYAPEEARADLIEEGLENHSSHMRREIIKMIRYARDDERADLIMRALRRDNDWYAIEQVAEEIEYIDTSYRHLFYARFAEIVEMGIEDNALPISILAYLDKETQTRIESRAIRERGKRQKGSPDFEYLRKLAGTTPLYRNGEKDFFRKEFSKSGSRTTLLDSVPGETYKTLKDRVIIRHIKIGPYLSWEKAFEAHDFWESKGFDYVPVEPILRTRRHGESADVDVFTRVLKGPSVAVWMDEIRDTEYEALMPYGEEIFNQIDKIKEGLVELSIVHGHPHEGNFVLYFERDENNEPDISTPPRVYVIDFDMAKSSGKPEDKSFL